MQVDPARKLSPEDLVKTAIYKAVEKAGGVPQLAKAMGVSRQAAYVWLLHGGAPLKRAIQLEGLYGLSRLQLLDPAEKALLTSADVVPVFANRTRKAAAK